MNPNEHDMVFIANLWGYQECSRCGALIGSEAYLKPCPVPPANDFGQKIAESMQESPFDRIDRQFKGK